MLCVTMLSVPLMDADPKHEADDECSDSQNGAVHLGVLRVPSD